MSCAEINMQVTKLFNKLVRNPDWYIKGLFKFIVIIIATSRYVENRLIIDFKWCNHQPYDFLLM